MINLVCLKYFLLGFLNVLRITKNSEVIMKEILLDINIEVILEFKHKVALKILEKRVIFAVLKF